MTALSASSLSKRFGKVQALDQLSLEVQQGAFFGLLGPNGAGKSTLMSIVSGFLKADSGTLELLGKPYTVRDTKQRNQIGYCPQHIALYKELSAEANLEIFAKLYQLDRSERREAVNKALELSQLTERRKSLVKEFSGGMTRRLNLAIALLHSPRILLCDEPTVGVDPQSRSAIFDTLKELQNNGLTILYSTHYMEEAERLCDQIAIIDHGQILRTGTVAQLLDELPPISSITCQADRISHTYSEQLGQFGQLDTAGPHLSLQPASTFKLSQFYLWVEQNDLDSRAFQIDRPTLENLFLQLTGRALRE